MGKKSILLCVEAPESKAMFKKALVEICGKCLVVDATNGSDTFLKAEKQIFDLIVLSGESTSLVGTFESLRPSARPRAVLVLSPDITVETKKKSKLEAIWLPLSVNYESLVPVLTRLLSMTGVAPIPVAALPPAPAVPVVKINVEFINPFITATLIVMNNTTSTKAIKEKVFVRQNDQISGDISAIVSMTSSSFKGSMAISFETSTFLLLAGRMLGEEYKEITPDISDAAGEICNQIFGLAKKKLNEIGHDIQPAIPSVVTGNGHKIRHLTNGPVIAVRFTTEAGAFTVEASIAGTLSQKADTSAAS